MDSNEVIDKTEAKLLSKINELNQMLQNFAIPTAKVDEKFVFISQIYLDVVKHLNMFTLAEKDIYRKKIYLECEIFLMFILSNKTFKESLNFHLKWNLFPI